MSAKKAVFTDEAFLHYRLDNESSSVNNPGKVFSVRKEYEEIENYLKKNDLYSTFGELMQMAKFGAYYWNIYQLKPSLRYDFIETTKEEFSQAKKDGMLEESLFLDKAQWKLLNFILNHDVKTSLKYIKVSGIKTSIKRKIRGVAKKCFLAVSPTYRKQIELSELISELENENSALKYKIKMIEKNRDAKK